MIVECPGCKGRYDVSGRPAGTPARCRCGTIFALPEPSRSAARLACPSCGAGVAPTAHRCEFCAAELLVRACPRCFARMFHGARHCSQCGAQVVAPARATTSGDAAPRGCPRCGGAARLDARLVGDTVLDECGACHGVWLDAAALERVVSERRGRSADELLGAAIARAPAAAAAPAASTYVGCPDCGELMNRINFARRSGIIVDVCKAHGTWFDADELPRVIAFAQAGGIEAAARHEAEEQTREVRRARLDAELARQRAGWTATVEPREVQLTVFGGLLRSIARLLVDR